MANHKKQHFVPRSYLSAWTDPATPAGQEPYVWVFSRDGANAKRRAPANVFTETDMYTITRADGSRDLVLEHGLAQLESIFADLRASKLERIQPLEAQDHVMLCAFMAAIHARTRARREHLREQWKAPLEMMERMMEAEKTATPEQKRRAATPFSSRNRSRSFSYDDVKRMVEQPLQVWMLPEITASTPLLARLDFAVFNADDELGFITSDNPCMWFDPEGCKRPPMFQAPALMYPTIEITLPISPRQCIVLNRQGMGGYRPAPRAVVDELNCRHRFGCDEHFIVRKNEKKAIWFDPGVEPADSWNNRQLKGGQKDPVS